MDTTEKILKYIKRTKPCEMSNRYQASLSDVAALAHMAMEGNPFDVISLACEYGVAICLRMGRAEARKKVQA